MAESGIGEAAASAAASGGQWRIENGIVVMA